MTSLGRTQIGGVGRGWVVREQSTNDPSVQLPYLCPAQTGHLYCKCKDTYCVKIFIGPTVCTYVLTSSAFHTWRGEYSTDENQGQVPTKLI